MNVVNKNKGFTLIELVVVVAIMAVLLVIVGVSFNTIFYNKTKAGSKNVYNMIGTAQMLGMSKGNVYLGLSADEKGNATVSVVYGGKAGTDFSVVESKGLGSKVEVKIKLDGVQSSISDSNSIMVEIDRKTGGFKDVYQYRITSGSLTKVGSNLTDIIIGKYDIALVKLTGKYFYR